MTEISHPVSRCASDTQFGCVLFDLITNWWGTRAPGWDHVHGRRWQRDDAPPWYSCCWLWKRGRDIRSNVWDTDIVKMNDWGILYTRMLRWDQSTDLENVLRRGLTFAVLDSQTCSWSQDLNQKLGVTAKTWADLGGYHSTYWDPNLVLPYTWRLEEKKQKKKKFTECQVYTTVWSQCKKQKRRKILGEKMQNSLG